MHVEELPDPGELWWPFAILAALDRARGRLTWTYDPAHRMLAYDGPDGARLCLQRMYASRMVIWGRPPSSGVEPQSWSGIPGWATSDAVRLWLRREGATLLAWHAHGEWDGATPDEDAAAVLDPLLSLEVPSDLVRSARAGRVTPDEVAAALDEPVDGQALEDAVEVLRQARVTSAPVQGQVRRLLAGEIHAQMRHTPERDRLLPQRPAALVRWARIAQPPQTFQFTLRVERGQLLPAPESDALPHQWREQLLNVLRQLLREETSDDGGAWLFARVRRDGPGVRLERRFDSLPAWYADTPPSLDALDWEMAQRHPDWRPAWASLLPGRQPDLPPE